MWHASSIAHVASEQLKSVSICMAVSVCIHVCVCSLCVQKFITVKGTRNTFAWKFACIFALINVPAKIARDKICETTQRRRRGRLPLPESYPVSTYVSTSVSPCLLACLPACLPLFKSSWGSAGWRCRVKAPLNYSTTISIVSGACCNIAGAETALSNCFSKGESGQWGDNPSTAIPLLLSRKAL